MSHSTTYDTRDLDYERTIREPQRRHFEQIEFDAIERLEREVEKRKLALVGSVDGDIEMKHDGGYEVIDRTPIGDRAPQHRRLRRLG